MVEQKADKKMDEQKSGEPKEKKGYIPKLNPTQ